MQQFLTSLKEISRNPPRRMLLLYSGGLDGTYLLYRMRELGTSAIALNVRIGEPDASSMAEKHAGILGIPYQEVDVTDQFFFEFLPVAVHADACYQDQYPVSSTITRPLMARAAVKVAREIGCDVIGHTATYMQNSAIRLSGSVSALAPDLTVAAPFLGSDLPRSEKLAALAGLQISFSEGIHSIDANPWARVIECGSLENPENYLDESVFRWTRSVSDAPDDPAEISLTFDGGLPSRLDDVPLSLSRIVTDLNALGGEHGVGRSSGLEDTPFMVKNHEIREAPAATVIIKAHQVLANAVLTPREHMVRGLIGREWTVAAVQGGWFTHLGESLARCLADLDRPLDGTVRLRLHKGSVTVLSVTSPNGLYYARLGETFHESMSEYAYTPWLSMATWPDRLRLPGTPKLVMGEMSNGKHILVDLSHPVRDGMTTYPGLPGPVIEDHMSWEDSHARYASGTEFQIGRITLVANTGTYVDVPAHRFQSGADLSEMPLSQFVDLEGTAVSAPTGAKDIGPEVFHGLNVVGRAVLVHTGWDQHWGTPQYGMDGHPFLSASAVEWLVSQGPAIVGIDSVNIDDMRDLTRPAHTGLLKAGIPIVEHMTSLQQVVGTRFRFNAAPVPVVGMGTFPVRAYALVEGDQR